jgi:hypothetical protein
VSREREWAWFDFKLMMIERGVVDPTSPTLQAGLKAIAVRLLPQLEYSIRGLRPFTPRPPSSSRAAGPLRPGATFHPG